MLTLFVLCAVVGGTILVCQFLLTLTGLGGGADFDGDHGGDAGHFGDLDTGADAHAALDPGDGHASSAVFGVLTFRTVVAALAFFGLAGLAADAAGWTPAQSVVTAIGSGLTAMYGVHYLLRLFAHLKSDGTVRLSDALNHDGIVYLRIPEHRTGNGKIHVVLKNQTIELQAETNGPAIPSGAMVRVNQFLGGDVVSVERTDKLVNLSATSNSRDEALTA